MRRWCQALDIFGSDGSIVDVLVDQFVFCVGRIVSNFDIIVDFVVKIAIGTHVLSDEVGRDPTEIGLYWNQDAYAICFLLLSFCHTSACLLQELTTISVGRCSNVLGIATNGDRDITILERTVGHLRDPIVGKADWRVFRNGIALLDNPIHCRNLIFAYKFIPMAMTDKSVSTICLRQEQTYRRCKSCTPETKHTLATMP